jgi:hypothetical protein
MVYLNRFRLADDVIAHLDSVVIELHDPFLSSRYAGFLAVAATTVYELAIRDILTSFAEKKHKVLGEFTRRTFERLNGRITIDDINNRYTRPFGEKYIMRFKDRVEETEDLGLRTLRISIRTSYSNVIRWRHLFAHEGEIPPYATYDEIRNSYQIGKAVIWCLSEAMQR